MNDGSRSHHQYSKINCNDLTYVFFCFFFLNSQQKKIQTFGNKFVFRNSKPNMFTPPFDCFFSWTLLGVRLSALQASIMLSPGLFWEQSFLHEWMKASSSWRWQVATHHWRAGDENQRGTRLPLPAASWLCHACICCVLCLSWMLKQLKGASC